MPAMHTVVANQIPECAVRGRSAHRGAWARVLAFAMLLCAAGSTWAASLTLAWDASAGAATYKVYYGTASRTYTSNVNAGSATSATISGLTGGQRYYFAVTALSASGAESGYSAEVSALAPSVPVASFTANTTSGQGPLTVTFNSSASNGTITSYAWTFGDGTTSTAANPTKTFRSFGSFTVALTVSGSAGTNTQTRSNYIVVTRAPTRSVGSMLPESAAFLADVTSGNAPLTVNFNSLSTGPITSSSWSFGDGATSPEDHPSHTYATPGIYTVALTVAGTTGSSVRSRIGYINVSPPGAPLLTPQWSALDVHAGAGLGVLNRRGSLETPSVPTPASGVTPGVTGNRNGVLEPGESVIIEPVWRNDSATAVTATGTIADFAGPPGATYTINDRVASYGTIVPGALADCRSASGNCYRITVSNPAVRPGQHWDATLHETLSTGNVSTITVHIGHSFSDVSPSDPAYVFAETMLHHGIMSPFSDGTFRPAATSSRSETMASVARALVAPAGDLALMPVAGEVNGASYACESGGASLYADVPPTDANCREVHFLAAYGLDVNAGCTDATHMCPAGNASRAMLAVLVAGASAGGDANVPASGTFLQSGTPRSYDCSSGGSSHFSDIVVSSAYCRHVNYLWAMGVIDAGADGGFAPSNSATRAQVAELVTRGLELPLH